MSLWLLVPLWILGGLAGLAVYFVIVYVTTYLIACAWANGRMKEMEDTFDKATKVIETVKKYSEAQTKQAESTKGGLN